MEWDRAEALGRLDLMHRTDPGFTRFGAAAHRYSLNPPLAESEVTAFEARHDLSLPEDYRAFLLQIGDGAPAPSTGSSASTAPTSIAETART